MRALGGGEYCKKCDDTKQQEEGDEDEEPTFDQQPVRVVCPHCGLSVITFIEHESSWVTYLVSIVLLLVLNWAAICVVPVVYPLFKDVVHHCPRCLSVLATRSRVVLPSIKHEVMSFRFGSCVVVLARKYVLMLLALVLLIGGRHWLRNSVNAPSGIDALTRNDVSPNTWDDFVKDCGFKSYLGNPIHVTMAFNSEYKNRTFAWDGFMHRVEPGVDLLWFNQRGALFTRMEPAQFPNKPGMADLMLLYGEGEKVAAEVLKLKKGMRFSFTATMAEVGKRGAPHVMVLWELQVMPGAKAAISAAAAALVGGDRLNGTAASRGAAPKEEAAATAP